ncbi:hypothetical protein ACHAXT_012854 [Thalassiosira profunda]
MAGFGGVAPPLPYSPKRKEGDDGLQWGSRPWRTKLRIGALFLALVALVLLRLGSDDAENDVGVTLPSDHAVMGDGSRGGEGAISGPAIVKVPREHNATTSFDEASVQFPDTSSAQDSAAVEGIQMDSGGLHWTDSHLPRDATNQTRHDVRISFRLHSPDVVPYPTNYLSVQGYACPLGTLPPSLSGRRSVLNFTATISTDLKILFVGDSISQQFAEGFYSSVHSDDYAGGYTILRSFVNDGEPIFANGKIFSRSGLHVCSSLVAPARGGGVSAYWRVLELMSKTTERKSYVNCKKETYWNAGEAALLSDHRYNHPPGATKKGMEKVETTRNNGATTWVRSETDNSTKRHRVGGFDACVLRPQHGWMALGDITRDRIEEEIRLCGKTAGAQTAIVSTLPLNNNVLTPEDWDGILRINEQIRDIALEWNASAADEVRWVLVQEFGNLTNQILWRNAKHIGYNITMPDFSQSNGWERQGSEFLLHRYHGIKGNQQHAPSIPMVCAYHIDQPFSTKNETAGQCFFNKISRDGMHWCVETFGPRYAVSVACLLGCVYNGGGPDVAGDAGVRRCEHECNDRFMSLTPVEESWIGTNATLYSKSG